MHPASRPQPSSVRKRDGRTIQPFNLDKIVNAIGKAFACTSTPHTADVLRRAAEDAVALLKAEGVVEIEAVQDAVELALMQDGHYIVAQAYIRYRQDRARARSLRQKPSPEAAADYTHFAHYARHLSGERRREVYSETVDRVLDMHLRHFHPLQSSALDSAILDAFQLVHEKRALPSMRSMQFAGPAIELNNNRMYNCTFTHINRVRAFQEAFYLLLCGSGVGFSVQMHHVEQLPRLARVDQRRVAHWTVGDTIEGWADALGTLIGSYMPGQQMSGHFVEFDYSDIRHEGAPLKVSGGKAPGHLPLKKTLELVRGVLDRAAGRRLRPIECHDIICMSSQAVLSGGIRRSAMISLFSPEDSEMMVAKTGGWYATHPWRETANNSVVLDRKNAQALERTFRRTFDFTREWGEPGFYFVADPEYGANPCCEIGLNPTLTVTPEILDLYDRRRRANAGNPDPRVGDVLSGWAFCNLTEINAAKFETSKNFLAAARAAAVIGTLQAAYTTMPYLGWVSEVIAEREALLGVSMTGMLDAPNISLDPKIQRAAAEEVVRTNREIAQMIGVRPAARATCVKPAGTTSLELGGVASGHGPHHARRFIRRITANALEPGLALFRQYNPHMCVKKPSGDWVIEFPIEVAAGAITKETLSALEHLEMVQRTMENWVLPGTARPESSPGLTHNVANTITVRASEWGAVAEFIWGHRETLAGIAMLSETGDKDYVLAPNEAIRTDADEIHWNLLISKYKPIDYTKVVEEADGTAFVQEPACSGPNGCAI